MTLVVKNKDITANFISFIKRRMLGYIASILDMKRLQVYDEYFNSEAFLRLTKNVPVDAKRVIVLGMSNLIHKRYETTTHIFINPHLTYPGTTIKIVDLCKIINYGTLSLDSYPIFSLTFNHFSKNIGKYADRCTMGVD